MRNAEGNSIRELTAKVREREQQLRAVFDCALDAMLLTDDQARYVDANPAACKLLCLPRELLLQMGVGDIMAEPPEDLSAVWSAFLDCGHSEGETWLRRADGSTVLVEFRATAHIIPGMHLSVLRDITERRNAEETRLRLVSEQRELEARVAIADRMSTVGTIAAGVAHEINNPIMAVFANLELAQRELVGLTQNERGQELTALRGQIAEALEATMRVTSIVRDIKLLSRASEPRVEAVDVHRVLESAVRIANNEIRHRASVVRHYGTIPLVTGDESRLGQVFLNLLINAAQAIPEGHADRHEIRLRTRSDAAAGRVEIDIEDSGMGLSEVARKKMFTPFFTTRPEGQGTGLGLAICRRIVGEQGGTITLVEGTADTVFRVSLPADTLVPIRGSVPPVVLHTPDSTEQRGRVLMVDDDLSICTSIEYFLRAEHEVSVFTSARQALVTMTQGARFDVILCDLMMPIMTGMELHAELSRLDPTQATRMVFLTGGAFTVDAQSFLNQVDNERLEKPFSLKTLSQLVERKVAEVWRSSRVSEAAGV